MKTIREIIKEFLEEQEKRLKVNTYSKYEDVMELFEDYLNVYAAHYFDEEEGGLYEKEYNERKKEYSDIFGPEKMDPYHFKEFMDYHMIRKVWASKTLMKSVGIVLKKFVNWLNQNNYIDKESFEESLESIKELKDELPAVDEVSELIFKFIQNSAIPEISETHGGYFKIISIKPDRIWFMDDIEIEARRIGPVFVSNEISSRCKVGWVICLELGKTDNGWVMLSSGNVYP